MLYCEVWLRGVKGIFSWHTEESLQPGARVVVPFRNQKKTGLVVACSQNKPEFATKPVGEVWDEMFLRPDYLTLAREVARENVTSLEKILSLMIPEKFFLKKNPEKREILYTLNIKANIESVTGGKQREVIEALKAEGCSVLNHEKLKSIASTQTITSLVKKNILTQEVGKIISSFRSDQRTRPSFDLKDLQQKALDQIEASRVPVLLRGVTGSGKTEIYKKLADKVLAEDASAQVLMLVPEIALTPQLVAEFAGMFGDQLAVWHSKLSEGDKVQEWAKIRSGQARVLIGARSGVFVPLANPKLIILDEEHEWTYKNEFAPRFWAHDIAENLAQKFKAKLVLGSATPRLESFVKAEDGAWTRVDLDTRVHETLLPEIFLVDLKQEIKKGNASPISEPLLERIQETLVQKKQAMLFLNKRGFSGSTMCRSCGQNFECPHCSHPMKMHQNFKTRKFICHVCGHLERFPDKCPGCDTSNFQFKGWGTQQVEQYLQEILPGIRTLRADADAITGKHDFDQMMQKFHDYEADILLGTQMIAKGLDFDRVDLVGVLLADVGLGLPDFRAEERVFQLLTQVSGRAGRRKRQGEIVIQTFKPDEKIFDYVRKHDSLGFLEWQKGLRKSSHQPPFSSFAKVTFSEVDKTAGLKSAQDWYKKVKNVDKNWDIFLAPAFFPRSHGKYHFHVLLRAPSRQDLIEFFATHGIPEGGKVDISPASLL